MRLIFDEQRRSVATGGRKARRAGSPGCWLVLLPLLSFALLGSGCMELPLTDNGGCISSQDCPPDHHCILGTCTLAPDFEVDVEVIPRTTANHLPYPVRAIDLDNPDGLRVIVPEPTVVRGELLLGQAPYTGDARLSFSSEGDLRRALRYTVNVNEEQDRSSSFEVKLIGSILERGRTETVPYSITVAPTNARGCCEGTSGVCPAPVMMRGMRFRTDTDDLVLAFSNDPIHIVGTVVTSDKDPTPKSGVRVQAWPIEGGGQSLVGESDEQGLFCVSMDRPLDGGDSRIKVRLSPSTADIQMPTVEHEISFEEIGLDDLLLPIGDYGSPELIQGTLLDELEEPLDRAQVTFTGEVASGGTYSATTFTDTEGRYEIEVFQGTYRVRAVPPEGSSSSAVENPLFTVDETAMEMSATPFPKPLPDRPLVRGRTVGPESDRPPLEDLEVIARLESLPGDEMPREESFSTQTDEDGSFSLAVDPGSYRLHFRPSWDSGLPWVVGPLISVEDGKAPDLETIVLEEPAVIDGKVLGAVEGGRTVPLAGSRVEVYARRRDETYLLWEGRADDDGAFQVLLPRSHTSKVEASPSPEEPDDFDFW